MHHIQHLSHEIVTKVNCYIFYEQNLGQCSLCEHRSKSGQEFWKQPKNLLNAIEYNYYSIREFYSSGEHVYSLGKNKMAILLCDEFILKIFGFRWNSFFKSWQI